MRRLRGDDGAVAVLVAFLAVAMFGFAALVIDVGALYSERRQLQNGADAGALAVAQACSRGNCGSFLADADGFADNNALDSAARIPSGGVCGAGAAGLPACTNPPTGLAGQGYVRVDTRTEQANGSTLVPPVLARVIDPTYGGTEVAASATVVWGAPKSVEADLALTMSTCEYNRLSKDAAGNTVFATAPYDPALERTIYFHDTTEAGSCPAGPSGADLPGGFGWLDSDANCSAVVNNGWVGDETGASASNACKAALEALLGKTVIIPVFGAVNGLTGTNGQYQITTSMGFVLTGWRFPGTTQASSYKTTNPNPCSNSQTCITGFVVEVTNPTAGPVGNGPNYGVTVTQLVS